METNLDSIQVLIVDDSLIVRKAIAKAAIQSGVDPNLISEAGNGQEALDSLDARPADVVFLDINMPVMNGEEFMVSLDSAGRAQDQYIVVVSTEVNAKRLMRMAKMGARGRLKKPFQPERLRELMLEAATEKAEAEARELADAPVVSPVDADLLAGALADALETMCFVIADPVDDIDATTLGHHASISIGEEEPTWRLSISASAELLIEIASGLMGTDPGEIDIESMIPATLLELANVFSGEFITLLGGEDIPYQPGIPEPESDPAAEGNAALRIGFDAMGEGLVVTLNPCTKDEANAR